MRRFWILPFLLLCGCMSNAGLTSMASSERNVDNLSRIIVGMDEEEVREIMKRPYSNQTFQMGGSQYDVWFYITNPTVLGQSRMVPQNLTPLTFKDGILVGWGFDYYNYLLKRSEEPQTLQENTKKSKTLEDRDLEKALEKTLQKRPPPIEKALDAAPKSPEKKLEKKPADKRPSKKAQNLKKKTAMSKRIKQHDNLPSCPDCDDHPPAKKEDESNLPEQNERSQEMQEEEREQNFDYW